MSERPNGPRRARAGGPVGRDGPPGSGKAPAGTIAAGGGEPAGPALPVLGVAPPERADAARNRRRILDAAEALFAQRGVAHVTVAEVAAAAGVGKATVFRRFGDKAALLDAVLGEHERALQDAILGGPPPLGPGAPPHERLHAFVAALLDYAEEHLPVLLASEVARPGARYATGAYAAWHQHAAILLAELRPDADAEILADVLLAPFAAELLAHLRERDVPRAQLAAALAAQVEALATPP